MKTTRKIIKEDGELFCFRSSGPEFRELKPDIKREERYDNGIRVYGSHRCANIQLRSFSPLSPNGKARHLIATASYLDYNEVKALIEKLQEILPTLYVESK